VYTGSAFERPPKRTRGKRADHYSFEAMRIRDLRTSTARILNVSIIEHHRERGMNKGTKGFGEGGTATVRDTWA
jgi:hypothetical protein